MQPLIYCDLDGVLVNLKGRLSEINNMDCSSLDSNAFANLFYDTIGSYNYQQTISFWENLEKTSDCDMLWSEISKYQPLILSSASGNKATVVGKKNWCKKNINLAPERVFCSTKSRGKQNFSCPQAILIDDLEQNIKEFRAKGGHGILHVSADKTITELHSLFKNNSFLFGS